MDPSELAFHYCKMERQDNSAEQHKARLTERIHGSIDSDLMPDNIDTLGK